jgi:hypothetical protein
MTVRTAPPSWFRIAAIVLLLWGLAALASFWMHLSFDPDDPANAAYDRQLYRSLPGWLNWVYAVAVGTAFAGAVALLLRRAIAVPLFALSLAAVVVQFAWTLGMTDLIAAKGLGTAAGFPLVIFALAVLSLWLAERARRRGWIG